MTLRKGYCDGPEGQIHWRMVKLDSSVELPDLYCFSPAPLSSMAYMNLLPALGQHQRAIAPDYPGQAGSDGGSAQPSIESYAASMIAVIQKLSNGSPVNVLGFHSGCLVAAEVKRQAPTLVDKAILIDVPAFDADTRAKYLPMVGAPFQPSPDLASVAKAWDMAVTKRQDTQPLDQCLSLFADIVGNGPRMNATFHAAFKYDVEARLAELGPGVAIIATKSSLLEPSRRAADLIPNAQLVELLDIERSVLDEHAEITAKAVQDLLV